MPETDSRAERVPFGIEGLDQVFAGGIPRGTLLLVEGRPGTGKTTIALQILIHGAAIGETCMLASNAERPEQLHAIAATHGWSLDGVRITEWREPAGTEDDQGYTLFPESEVEVGESLESLFAEIERNRPTLLVIDTISALRVLAPTPAFYRRQLRRIRDFLAARQCTTLVLDDASVNEMDARSQTLSDGILELRHIDFEYGADRRRLRVRKLRASTYVGGAHDFVIEKGGLVVFPRLLAPAIKHVPQREPMTSGVAGLDALSGGGLPRGTCTLITGPAGAGKSTLAAAYASAAAERGERSSIILFDESVENHLARSKGLGLDVAGAMDAGLIQLLALDPAEFSPGQIGHLLARQVAEEGVALVVIDTLNGYMHSALEEPAVLLQLRELLSYLGRQQVVTLLTLTQHGILGTDMTPPVDVSYLADNVFLLRYFESGGRIRQALSMVKKRTGVHERAIRELLMTGEGISVGEPLEDFARVLTGSPVYRGA
jgi:circadian clock protein KaiC